MKKMYKYEGSYGSLVVDLEEKIVVFDKLDRKKIWEDACEDYVEQQNIFSQIIEELFGEDTEKIFPPEISSQYWNGRVTDYGFVAKNDKFEFVVAAGGAWFI